MPDCSAQPTSGFGFDIDVIVDYDSEFLLAAQILLCRLHAYVPKKELDLLQFAACDVTQSAARAAQIMRRKFADLSLGRELLHDTPDYFLRDAFSCTPDR